jgi:hypothetical protein
MSAYAAWTTQNGVLRLRVPRVFVANFSLPYGAVGCWGLRLWLRFWTFLFWLSPSLFEGRCRMIFGEFLIRVRMGGVYAGVLYLMYIRCLVGCLH